MEYDKFLAKYNKIDLIENCTIDIDLLKVIHKYLFGDSPSEQSIVGVFRYTKGQVLMIELGKF